jgi:hypothetical protein
MKHLRLLLPAFLLVVCASVSASVTEIRHNFLSQVRDLTPHTIMLAPAGDASYLISVYESTVSCGILPTLRWTDENGVARSQQGVVGPPSIELPAGNCYVSLLAKLRVHANTAPTIETNGDNNRLTYSLYVSGLGFWPGGEQGQGGLSEMTGTLPGPPPKPIYGLAVYKAQISTSALLVAYSTGYAGRDVPFLSWTDENGHNSLQVPVGTAAVVPVRIAGGTKVWIHTYPGDTTWYALIVFGAPGAGAGPFGDYEANLLDWTNATYPNWQTLFTAGSSDSNVLLMSNVTQPANAGTVSEGLQVYWTNQTAVPCAAALVAGPSGVPASCVSPVFVGSSNPLQVRTYNSTGSPWGPSPTYSAEVDLLVF